MSGKNYIPKCPEPGGCEYKKYCDTWSDGTGCMKDAWARIVEIKRKHAGDPKRVQKDVYELIVEEAKNEI
jgi:hypothetical protein